MATAPLVNIKDLSITVNGEVLFERLSFAVEPGEMVALIGPNGCGKSTILNHVYAQVGSDAELVDNIAFEIEGSVFLSPHISVGYLPQVLQSGSVSDDLSRGFESFGGADYERLCRDFDVIGGSDDTRVSGGELQKRFLARVLAADSDLYLLDEPTNYMDLAGITALEYYCENFKSRGKGLIVVTHDRAFTDNLADRTILVTSHRILGVAGGATAAWSAWSGDFESRSHRAKEIDKKIKQLQKDVIAKAGWAAASEKRKIGAGSSKPYLGKLSKKIAMRAKAVRRRAEREIGRLEEVKPFVAKKVSLHFPDYEVRNRDVFSLRDVRFDYRDEADGGETRYLLRDVDIAIRARDRLCLMGKNGSGKSTLLKLLLGQLRPKRGEAYRNASVKVVGIPQGLTGFFKRERLLDNFDDCGFDETTIRQYLGSVLIRRDEVEKSLDSFSQGELMRAAVVKGVLSRAEFLLLDEPTSHLDIESIDVLEQLLRGFAGGYLVISHDRSFAASIASKLYMLDDGSLDLV
ncbi:MAG: ATP-binding cassette domain-containing protein [Candidatus Zixiibacteriota bacterium]